MPVPDPAPHVPFIKAWFTTTFGGLGGGLYAIWHWLAGDASGLTLFVGFASFILALLGIAEKIIKFRERSEKRKASEKLMEWLRRGTRSRPAPLDSQHGD